MQAPRILIVKLSAIGDVVLATPIAETIKKAYSGCYLAWLVEQRCQDVVLGNPCIDEVFVWRRSTTLGSLSSASKVVKELRSRKFDIAVDAQGLARSAVYAYLCGAATRIGYETGRECSRSFYNRRVSCETPHGVNCHAALVEPLGIPAKAVSPNLHFPLSDDSLACARKLLVEMGVHEGDPFAVFVPATTRANKHWVEDHWSSLAEDVSSRLGLTPVFLGGPGDTELVERIISRVAARRVSLAGRTTLSVAAAVASLARLSVAVDTGLLHIGVALGVPTVGVFGPTSAWRNHASRSGFRVVRKELPCAPCRKKVTCENIDCMCAVTPGDVLSAAEELLSTSGPGSRKIAQAT